MFLRLDPLTGTVDSAYVKWFVDGTVCYDVVDARGNRWDNRVNDEATFMGRWHLPERGGRR